MTITIHPTLYQEFTDKCKLLKVKEPNYLIAAMMRGFLIECKITDDNPQILVDSTLVENTHQDIKQEAITQDAIA